MYQWTVTQVEDKFFAALVDDNDVVIRTHPIEFTDQREARRAAERLNKRDF